MKRFLKTWVGVGLFALLWASCAQKQQSESASSSEPWPMGSSSERSSTPEDDADARSDSTDSTAVPEEYSDECTKLEAYDKQRSEPNWSNAGERVTAADGFPGVPEGTKEVVVHTLESSFANQSEWRSVVGSLEGHLTFSLKGELGLPPRDPEFSTRRSPIQELIDIVEACEPARGLFHGLGQRVFGGENLHLFECAPNMPNAAGMLEIGRDSFPDEVRSVWRVGRAIVKCDYPQLHVEFIQKDASEPREELLPKSQLPERIRTWFDDVLTEVKQNHPPNWSDFHHFPLVERYFYLEPVGRGWKTYRTISFDRYTNCDDPELLRCDDSDAKWREWPEVNRHWFYEFEETGDR